jgi:murein DD-endopeptidase MepM/ murein hydrolase activator NlpD
MRIQDKKLLYVLPVFVVAAVLVAFVFLNNDKTSSDTLHEPIAEMVEEVYVEFDEFGFPPDAYRVEQGVVGARQTLSHILDDFGFSRQEIFDIAGSMKDIFDPRRIRRGNNYFGYFLNDSTDVLNYFIYEITDLDYVMLDFRDSLLITRGQKEVVTVEKSASGIIHSSLWLTLMNQGLHPELVMHMARVMAWTVDFYRIEAGDRFRVLYAEDYVGDRSVGVSRIDAVHFMHRGQEYEAYRFVSDTIDGYFDGQGNNMRKTFLRAPLEYGRISSRYSHSRRHPIHGDRRPHYGTDYAAPHGTPILAVGDGVITKTSYTRGNGNYVRIRHNAVYETQYLHMSRFASGMKPGVRVTQGDVIGYVGSTGFATGPHVCFRFWENGQQVDHLKMEFPSGDPLPKDFLPAFTDARNSYRAAFEMIGFDDIVEL